MKISFFYFEFYVLYFRKRRADQSRRRKRTGKERSMESFWAETTDFEAKRQKTITGTKKINRPLKHDDYRKEGC